MAIPKKPQPPPKPASKPAAPAQSSKPAAAAPKAPTPAQAAPKTVYMVCEGRTVQAPGKVRYGELTTIPDGTFRPDEIAGLIQGGSLRAIKPERPASAIKPKFTTRGRWDFDPDDLAGDSLEDLNVRIIERDPSRRPYETREEAIAVLTADFQG